MKKINTHIFSLTIISIFMFHLLTQAQAADPGSGGRTDAKTPEAVEAKKKVADLTFKSGVSFKQGLLNMQDNRRQEAGKSFDNAVEVFLMSGVNVSRNPKLQNCYNQLVETVYRLEFPSSAQQPQVRSLSATCGWNWNENDYKTADAVTKLVSTATTETTPKNSLISLNSTLAANTATQGFNEQKVEVSPLDDLAKIELMPEDQETLKSNNAVPKPNYARPLLTAITVQTSGIRIVKAKAGETLTKLAEREGVSAVELAKYNGLLPTTILSAGREVKIPGTIKTQQSNTLIKNTRTETKEETNCKKLISPNVQNLRLGMTINEVSKILNKNISIKKLPGYYAETYFATVTKLNGVRQLLLNFYRGKLFLIKVNYDDSIEWNGMSEFQRIISKTLNIPNDWKGEYSFEKSMFCTNFNIKITNLSSNNFSLAPTDTNAIQSMIEEMVLDDKKKKEREKIKKENFKP